MVTRRARRGVAFGGAGGFQGLNLGVFNWLRMRPIVLPQLDVGLYCEIEITPSAMRVNRARAAGCRVQKPISLLWGAVGFSPGALAGAGLPAGRGAGFNPGFAAGTAAGCALAALATPGSVG